MKPNSNARGSGFTLLETVIAIGVLAVLLTGFMVVFAPAAAGIRKSINVQEADRLTSTLEQELVTLRGSSERSEFKTGFGKAFKLIEKSNDASSAILVYQYRADPKKLRPDDSPEPVSDPKGKMPGKVDNDGYILQSMMRRKDDALFKEDLPAIEGGIYAVKCTQLVYDTASGGLKTGTIGTISDPKNSGTSSGDADSYPEAVIAFSAEFFNLQAKSKEYLDSRFTSQFPKMKSPVFTRNLAVRR